MILQQTAHKQGHHLALLECCVEIRTDSDIDGPIFTADNSGAGCKS